MSSIAHRIAPCLWFDTQAEAAAEFYAAIFENSRIKRIARYGEVGRDVHGREARVVLTIEMEIEGQNFVFLNGGPQFKFTEAVSFQVFCDTQQEIDRLWLRLSEGGETGQCGWLKDKFGLSWQIVPSTVPNMIADADPARSDRVMAAMLKMQKLDLAELQRAFNG